MKELSSVVAECVHREHNDSIHIFMPTGVALPALTALAGGNTSDYLGRFHVIWCAIRAYASLSSSGSSLSTFRCRLGVEAERRAGACLGGVLNVRVE